MARPNFAALKELAWQHPELLLAALLAGVDPVTGRDGYGLAVSSIVTNWRSDFVGANGAPPDATKWRDASVTPGTTTAALDGAGNLLLTSGVAANQERILESVPTFTVGELVRISAMLSARTANVEARLELVSVDPATGLTDGDSLASWALLGGDTATQGRYEVGVGVGRGGAVQQSAAVTIGTSASQQVYEITLTNDEVVFSQRPIDSVAGRAAEQIKTQNVPDPNKLYRLRIRLKTLGVAPGVNTTLTVAFASCTDYEEGMVEVTGGRGSTTAGAGVPVNVANTVALASTAAVAITAPSTSASTTVPATLARIKAAATTNATSVKTTTGKVLGWDLFNNGAAPAYFKVYNKASAPTVGTDVPLFTIGIPAGGRATFEPPIGMQFTTGLAYAIVTGAADTDATAVAADQVHGVLTYV